MRKRFGQLSGLKRPLFDFVVGDAHFSLGRETKIMGVLNVTPDSFSDGGRFLEPALAVKRALQMEAEGAHWIDIGAESSRPGARPVSAKEEIKRLGPVLRRLAGKIKTPLSIDTYKYDTAHAVLDLGVRLINDIFALSKDRRLAKLLARYKASVILMHMQGSPQTMQKKPKYKNTLAEIGMDLKKAVHRALDAGISRNRIMLDPGFGFGKSAEHNRQILAGLESLADLGYPVMVGLSRKSFVGHLIGVSSASDRLYGSLAAAGAALERGAHAIRVHDVLAHKQFSTLLDRL